MNVHLLLCREAPGNYCMLLNERILFFQTHTAASFTWKAPDAVLPTAPRAAREIIIITVTNDSDHVGAGYTCIDPKWPSVNGVRGN